MALTFVLGQNKKVGNIAHHHHLSNLLYNPPLPLTLNLADCESQASLYSP